MTPLGSIEDFQAVFDAAPDGILLVDGSGHILHANPEAHRLFRYDDGRLIGRSIEDLVPEDLRAAHTGHRADYAADPHSRPMGIGLELAGVRKDGVRIPMEISLSPLRSDQDTVVIATVRDLTERRRLKGFGAAALKATEEERRRIARELHDDTAQRLAGLLMRLSVVRRTAGPGPVAYEIDRIRDEVAAVGEGVRVIARGLRPPELEDVGLAAALRSFVRSRFPSSEIELTFDGSEARMTAEQSLVAYRITQEALSNVARHAGASQVSVEIRAAGPEALVLEIRDDGRGFDPDDRPEPPGGLGIVGMEERAEIAGGALEIDSEPGVGTTIRFHLATPGETS